MGLPPRGCAKAMTWPKCMEEEDEEEGAVEEVEDWDATTASGTHKRRLRVF